VAKFSSNVVLGLAALLLAVQIGPWYYTQRDAAAYISIARNLAHGAGLINMGSQALWFPPGYSLLLSPLFLARDLPLLEISVVHCLLGVGFLLGIYRWARPLAPVGAVWIAAISVGTWAVWIQYRRPMSEMAFMAMMAWLLVSLDALARSRGRGRFLAWLAAVVGLTIALCLIRSVGIALAAGGSCSLLARAGRSRLSPNRQVAEVLSWRPALGAALAVSAAAVITVGGVVLREHRAAQPLGASTYLNSIETRRSPALVGGYGPWCALVFSEIGRVTVPFMFKSHGKVGSWRDVNMLIYVPLFGLLLYGYLRWIRRSDDPLAWSMPFYLAVLTYFRWESGARWWVPMTPALFMCLWFALEPWGRRVDLLRAVWLLHVLAGLAYWIAVDLPQARRLDRKWPIVRSLADQITVGRDRVLIDESMTDNLGMLFEMQLDRRVKEHKRYAPIPTSAEWLIIPIKQEPPPGFVPRSSCGGCELLHRG